MRVFSRKSAGDSTRVRLHELRNECAVVELAENGQLACSLREISREIGTDKRHTNRAGANRAFYCPSVFDWLGDLASQTDQAEVQLSAIELLGRIGGKADVTVLARIARRNKLEIYEESVQALKRIGGQEAESQIRSFAEEREDELDRILAQDIYESMIVDDVYDSSIYVDWPSFSGLNREEHIVKAGLLGDQNAMDTAAILRDHDPAAFEELKKRVAARGNSFS